MSESSSKSQSQSGGERDGDAAARRKRQALPPARMGINLTSMLDVIFLLLIYFVITADFVIDEGVLTARMPRGTGETPEQQLEPPPQKLNIELTSLGATGVSINVGGTQRVSSFTELAETLTGLQHDPERGLQGVYPPDNPVVIKPAGEVRWQHVVNAFNAAIKARYSNVAFSEAQ